MTDIPKRKAPKSGHVRPRAPMISLNEIGRLRVAHLLSLFGVSHATLYKRLQAGLYPPPTGRDGRMPWWSTATVKAFLEAPGPDKSP